MELFAPPSESEFTERMPPNSVVGPWYELAELLNVCTPVGAPLTTTLSRLFGFVGWVSIIVEPLNDRSGGVAGTPTAIPGVSVRIDGPLAEFVMVPFCATLLRPTSV